MYRSGSAAGEAVVEVPAGEFWRGCHPSAIDCFKNENPGGKVFVSAFSIDKTEVTSSNYEACVQGGKCTPAKEGPYCNYQVSVRENHPVNCVDWTQAKTYCESQGKRLPTEAEWEKAARGVADGRIYPWGDSPPTCDYAVMREKGIGCGKNSTWPVGSKPKGASPYGALDMVGNVIEWSQDWYDENAYQSNDRDPKGPLSGSYRVIRGGGFFSVEYSLSRVLYRDNDTPTRQDYYVGFRCAR